MRTKSHRERRTTGERTCHSPAGLLFLGGLTTSEERLRNEAEGTDYRQRHSRWFGSWSQRHWRSRSACSRSMRGHSFRVGSRSQRWARARSDMICALRAVSLARLAAAASLRLPLSTAQAATEAPSKTIRLRLRTGRKMLVTIWGGIVYPFDWRIVAVGRRV